MIEAVEVHIPTHPQVWEVLQRHAQSPDRFIEAKIAEFAGGDSGKPTSSGLRRA